MALWKKLWLLFTVLWVVLAVLQAATILAVGEEPAQKALRPALLAVAVPAILYLLLWSWARLRRR